MPRLDPSSLRHLRERLRAQEAALPFAAAVATQLAHAPGAPGDEATERAAADRVVRLLEIAASSPTRAGGEQEEELLEDPHLLSAVFQNLDLLYVEGYPAADAVGRLLARLVDRAEAAS